MQNNLLTLHQMQVRLKSVLANSAIERGEFMQKLNLEKIKQLRKNKRLSQGDMARIIGLNTLYPYHRKESGAQSFTAEELHTIAEYFGLPVEYFFTHQLADSASKNQKEAIS